MNDFTIKTPTIRVPGLLTDDAMQEQLKQFKQSGLNGGATPVPDGAVELADRVTNEFLDSPMRNLLKTAAAAAPTPISTPANAALALTNPAKPDPQQQAIDLRSDIMADPNNSFGRFASFIVGPLVRPGGMVDTWGTLTPEESAKLQQERIEQGKEELATVERHNKVREQLRGMTDEQAAATGFPVQPGMDDQTQKELEQKQDEDRLQAVKDYVKQQTVEAPKKTWWLDAINSFDRSFSSSVTSMGKSAAIGLVELPGELTGVRNSGRSDLRAWFDTVDAAMEKMIPPDKARDQDFINLLSAGGGSMSTFLVGGLVGKTLGIPAKASTLVLGAATQASQQYEDAEAHNGTELQRLISFFAGAGLGATEAIPINRMLGRAEQATGGMVSKMLRNTATSSLEEFTQELGQNIGTDVVAKWLYDEQRKMNWSGYLKQAAVGGILGMMGGAATTVMENSGIMAPRDSAEAQAERNSEEGQAQQQAMEARQQEVLTRIIDTAQTQFDQITGQAEGNAAANSNADISSAASSTADTSAADSGTQTTPSAAATPTTPERMLSSVTQGLPAQEQNRIPSTSAGTDLPAGTITSGVSSESSAIVEPAAAPVNVSQEPVIDLQGEELVNLAMRAPKSDAFNEWFGDSKVKDESGAPLVVYHGSASSFTAFDPNKAGSAIDSGFLGAGAYFTNKPSTAAYYASAADRGRGGQQTYPVYVSLKNPFMWGDKTQGVRALVMRGEPLPGGITEEVSKRADFNFEPGGEPDFGAEKRLSKAVTEVLEERGHDGVIASSGSDRIAEIVAFKPTQIKSVNNAGNFDPSNPDILASTSSTRGSYKAEPKRNDSGVAGQTDANADNISLRKIADNFTKLLGLTVRQGRFTIKGADVMGQFSAKSGVVRLRTPNDLSSLIHEGGHALEVNADGELKTFVANNRVMLQTIARKLYGGDVSNLPDKAKTSEGFAEFFRVYVTNKRFAEINYPTITTDFDALLDRTNPQLRDGLKLIGDQYAAWLQMPSSQLLRNMVQSGKQTDGINTAIKEMRDEGLVNWFREVVNGVHSATINRFDTLNQLVAGILNTSEAQNNKVIDLKRADDPRALIRLAANSGQRAMVQLTDGVMGHRSTDPFTPGLRAALVRYHGKAPDAQLSSIDANRQRDFAAYLVALRGIDEYNRFSQGIIERPPVAATLGDLTTVVSEMEKQYGDDFKDAAQMVHQYAMGLWEKSHDAGLIDDQTYEDGKNRTFYVPLQRDMSDKQMTQSGISASQARQGRSIVKRFRGSDRDIIDPVDALMQKTFALEKVIAENEVKVALAKLADKAGTVGSLVERVPANKLLGQQYSIQEVARQLTKDPTMSPTDAADLMSLLEAAIDDGNRIALFRSQQAMAAGENIVFFWENGKLSALQLQDGDVGADVLNTLNAVGTETVPFLVDLIAYPSTVFRAAVTSWPDFLLVNFVRDQMSAFVLTEGYTPFVSGLRGVGDELRQHGWAREYNAAMGTMGGMNSSTLHDARVKTDINALRKRGYIAKAFRSDGGGYAGAIKGLARVTELTETGTRLGIFRSAYDRAIKDGLTPWEASVEASYISTDYIDFSLHGNRMLAWRRLVPFLNAQLQGLNKMVRTLAGDEVRQRRGLMFAVSAFFKDVNNLPLSRTEKAAVRTGRKAWLKMASLGIIGAALQAAFQDDPDYQDASEYLRTTGWVIPIGNGQIFYIPKPFELAMVSNFVERGFEIGSGDTEAKNRLLRGMAMNLLPPTNPPAIQSVVEQLANWDSFSGREIVPDYMRALEPELQYNHFTTGFAKSLGSTLGWSPMRIDHFMSGIGASAYRDLTQMYDTSDPNRPSSDVSDWPITRRFVRDARRGAVSAQDFWKFASTVTGSLRRAEVTYKSYIDSGKEAAAENFLSELSPDERAYAVLNTHFKAEYKRLNPMYRVAQENGLISAMRRELYSDQGVENTMKGNEDAPIMLSAKEKADVDNVLSELSRREMRNALIFMKAPGWANKRPLPTEPTIELLRATSPDTADEFERRIKKAKVYTAETVQDYWPEVRDRLIQDGDGAFLKDILAVAKAMR